MDNITFTPTPAPLRMPEQNLDWYTRSPTDHLAGFGWPGWRTAAARTTVALVTILVTAFAVHEMYAAANVGGMASLEWLLIIVFTVTSAWIGFSAGTAVAGALFAVRHPKRIKTGGATGGLTALVMPVYNENPREVFSALAAMIDDLPREARAHFEVFILSDTTNAETWIAEERALANLRRLAGGTRVWYRRRRHNTHRKAGNVADFVRRWGGRYDHMVVLDADSLMTGKCLAELRQAMIDDPKSGIIQTGPILIGGTTPFARAQQFANTITGPVVSEGVSAWQGDDGNYWGHNAIIRMEAFASAAGLPQLPGKPPFGGTILSHDFVEAALIRRAGWSVTLRNDIKGSYEGAPTDLFGIITRDRRWAQGNLQHGRIVGAAGLTAASRVHFLMGIFAYLMSPIWLLLILTGMALAVQATFIRPEYFPHGFALFPNWPAFDVERLIQLFILSMGVLLLPKALGLMRAILHGPTRRAAGGSAFLVAGAFVELLISTMIAPIMMLAQTQIVFSIMLGRAVGWTPQARQGASVPWAIVARYHMLHVLVGIALAAIAWFHSPELAAWMSPTLVALIFAVPISKAMGSPWLGRRLRRAYLMITPQEAEPPEVLRTARRLAHYFPAALPGNALITLADDQELCWAHRLSLEPGERGRGKFDAATALATVKLDEAESLEELADWLEPQERLSLLSDTGLLDRALALRAKKTIRAA
ncbi:glucans biosynthesis glucosyltransferase MdoH [Acuticoccus sp. M5D2P5]|uniref:glucans biosynthesis glucosyltransferase MdoH n=1 Tax=Acuticoccus kalidii TaxID=2910977 RepID=UPI001F330512|nr:glucans biosynthesis glucosyltransferase MdoH [Acuticoccus kalidii]MCF3934284.1 glucans biosynthesis glucosyltransferase MdoH [Acuticoccus kalidii]